MTVMSRLTADEIRGVWAGITMSWDAADRFDEASYRTNINKACGSGAYGVYTTGSTGEFYAIDENEFRNMVDIQAEICGTNNVPLQIGCCADATRKTLRLVEYAASKAEVGAVQIVLPYWMELTEREVLQFFRDIYTLCPDMPIVHYNIPRAKGFLNGADYLKIAEVAPSLVGVKYTFGGSNFGALQGTLRALPHLSFFVAENLLASAMQLGARGTYSSLVSVNPQFMLNMYEHAAAGRWEEAIELQRAADQFFGDAAGFIQSRGEGTIDPVFDKGLAVAAGTIVGSARTRAPYIGWTDETVLAMREWLIENYPQFVEPSLLGETGEISESPANVSIETPELAYA
jgi:4-hydroxy-tetrahydrodipicolinate synthase